MVSDLDIRRGQRAQLSKTGGRLPRTITFLPSADSKAVSRRLRKHFLTPHLLPLSLHLFIFFRPTMTALLPFRAAAPSAASVESSAPICSASSTIASSFTTSARPQTSVRSVLRTTRRAMCPFESSPATLCGSTCSSRNSRRRRRRRRPGPRRS
jgi:hypothetical protein